MKAQNHSILRLICVKLTNYMKDVLAPESLDGIKLDWFGGSIREYMRYLQQYEKNK